MSKSPDTYVVNPEKEPESGSPGYWYRLMGSRPDDADRLGFDVHVRVVYDGAQRPIVQEVRLLNDTGLLAEQVNEVPLSTIRRLLTRVGPDDLKKPAPITRVKGDRDGFYRQVAQHYRFWMIRTNAPAKEIADDHGIPVTRVHRWIGEARKAGLLPKGQQGRAG